jgi:hypothetical protein
MRGYGTTAWRIVLKNSALKRKKPHLARQQLAASAQVSTIMLNEIGAIFAFLR